MLFGFLCSLLMGSDLVAQDYLAMARPKDSKEWGYIDEKGKMVIKAQYRTCFPFNEEGYAVVNENRKFMFIDTKGKELKTGYKKFYLKEFSFGFGAGTVLAFNDGLAPIRERKGWGFLNKEGKLAIEMKYDNVSGFKDGLAFAIIKNKFFILDPSGKETAVNVKDIVEIKRPSEGMVAYRAKNKLMGFVNGEGEAVIKAKYIAVGRFVAGVAWARNTDDQFGYIDKKGNWVIKPQFDAVKNFDPVAGLARVKDKDGWGYINKDGKKLKLNIETEVYGDFVDGLAKGRKDKKFGFFGPDGNWVIKPQLQGVGKVSSGFIPAKENDLWGFIDMKGKWVIEPQFEGIRKMVKVN